MIVNMPKLSLTLFCEISGMKLSFVVTLYVLLQAGGRAALNYDRNNGFKDTGIIVHTSVSKQMKYANKTYQQNIPGPLTFHFSYTVGYPSVFNHEKK